jgi:predicted component of type VI protein secretion system
VSSPGKKDGAEEPFLLLATERQIHAFDLSQTFRVAIGRHESNDLQLSSRTVSNYHAEILNESEGLVLHDLRSTNGTFVNEKPISRHVLAPADRIRIGNFVLTVHRQPRRSPSDTLYRLSEASSVPRTINLPTDAVILEGMKEVEELDRLRKILPPFDQKLQLKENCTLPLCALSPAEIEVFQGLIRHETIEKAVENSALTDSRVVGLVNALLQKGVFEISDSATPSLLEATILRRPERSSPR